jgi:hypothetical protein
MIPGSTPGGSRSSEATGTRLTSISTCVDLELFVGRILPKDRVFTAPIAAPLP